MRYGRQRWRLRGRVEVSNKQIWDSEEYIFLPLVTELLSIKVIKLVSESRKPHSLLKILKKRPLLHVICMLRTFIWGCFCKHFQWYFYELCGKQFKNADGLSSALEHKLSLHLLKCFI